MNIAQRKHIKDVQQLEKVEKALQELQTDQTSCRSDQMELESELVNLR